MTEGVKLVRDRSYSNDRANPTSFKVFSTVARLEGVDMGGRGLLALYMGGLLITLHGRAGYHFTTTAIITTRAVGGVKQQS